jgi:hypothetical protein
MYETSGGRLTCPHDLSTKYQKRAHSLMRFGWKEACADGIFPLSVIGLRQGLNMLPLAESSSSTRSAITSAQAVLGDASTVRPDGQHAGSPQG